MIRVREFLAKGRENIVGGQRLNIGVAQTLVCIAGGQIRYVGGEQLPTLPERQTSKTGNGGATTKLATA